MTVIKYKLKIWIASAIASLFPISVWFLKISNSSAMILLPVCIFISTYLVFFASCSFCHSNLSIQFFDLKRMRIVVEKKCKECQNDLELFKIV